MADKHPSHKTRFSDASTFDEICIYCGATDIAGGGWGQLQYPCPKAPAPPPEEETYVHNPPNRQESIKNIYAYLSVDENGEGICGHSINGVWMPLLTGEERLVQLMRPIAQEVATATGKKIRLVQFSVRTELGELEP